VLQQEAKSFGAHGLFALAVWMLLTQHGSLCLGAPTPAAGQEGSVWVGAGGCHHHECAQRRLLQGRQPGARCFCATYQRALCVLVVLCLFCGQAHAPPPFLNSLKGGGPHAPEGCLAVVSCIMSKKLPDVPNTYEDRLWSMTYEDLTYEDLTYEDLTYEDLTYEDLTYEDLTYEDRLVYDL